MRRSLILRITALVALLGVIGVFASGCSGIITIIIGWNNKFFERFCDEIYCEDAKGLADGFYAPFVHIESKGGYVDRGVIEKEWRDYFNSYYIEESSLLSEQKISESYLYVVMRITRTEVRKREFAPGYYGTRERVYATEEYTCEKSSDGDPWRITRVMVISSDVYPIY